MSVAGTLAALVGDPLATATAKAARLERKEADGKAALEALAGREAAARAAYALAVADEGDTKAAARDLANLVREREALSFEAEAAAEAAATARRTLAEVRERVAREEAEAAVAATVATVAKARKATAAKLREVRDLTAGTWEEERKAQALAKAAGLELGHDFGLDLGAVCEELNAEVLATNPPAGMTNSVPLSLRVLARF